jgi:3-oxoacyl-[acyl-carrier protein] reductase
MNTFENKIALITGSSRGIGKSIALELAKEGAFVIIQYTNNRPSAEQALNEVNAIGGKGELVRADFSHSNSIDDLFSQVNKILSGKKIDFLINNAGVLEKGSVENVTEEQFDNMFNVNVKSVFFITQHFIPIMNNEGRIINISSNLSKRPRQEVIAYSMTKAAIDNFTITLASTLGSRQITVNSVAPGATDTDMNKERFKDPLVKTSVGNMNALKRVGTPDDIAKVVTFLCSENGGWITGQYIEASGGAGL